MFKLRLPIFHSRKYFLRPVEARYPYAGENMWYITWDRDKNNNPVIDVFGTDETRKDKK